MRENITAGNFIKILITQVTSDTILHGLPFAKINPPSAKDCDREAKYPQTFANVSYIPRRT